MLVPPIWGVLVPHMWNENNLLCRFRVQVTLRGKKWTDCSLENSRKQSKKIRVTPRHHPACVCISHFCGRTTTYDFVPSTAVTLSHNSPRLFTVVVPDCWYMLRITLSISCPSHTLSLSAYEIRTHEHHYGRCRWTLCYDKPFRHSNLSNGLDAFTATDYLGFNFRLFQSVCVLAPLYTLTHIHKQSNS